MRAWSSISLFGHAPEVQVSRWGGPLLTHLFLSDPDDNQVEAFHTKDPSRDRELFGPTVERFVRNMTTLAGTTHDPAEYARRVSARILPALLPYKRGSKAAFTVETFNGWPLGDDALDVMFSLEDARSPAPWHGPSVFRTSTKRGTGCLKADTKR